VHQQNDPEFAKKQGSPNMFMNILTTNGCACGFHRLAGPEAMVTSWRSGWAWPSFPNICCASPAV